MNRLLPMIVLWIVVGSTVGVARGNDVATEREAITPEQRERAVAILQNALAHESKWVKVHAAEYLLELSYPDGVASTFEAERAAHDDDPQYRIGIWRVLARAASSEKMRRSWIEKIRSVLLDRTATDHIHAFETLAKLGDQPLEAELRAATLKVAQDEHHPGVANARWLLAGSEDRADADFLDQFSQLLDSPKPAVRLVTAYGLQWLWVNQPPMRDRLRNSPQIRTRLQTAAQAEAKDSPARAYLLSAAWLLSTDAESAESFREMLLIAARDGTETERGVACAPLMERGSKADVPVLLEWLDAENADVRVSAAAALLRIGRRDSHHMSVLDWCVIALYFASMLVIGWYYSFRTKTTEDYLLGGRNMKPWAVGLSLFATLVSTISYLATPGEMIQHGPMYFTSIAAFPVVTLVVGWWLIPCFMKLPVTSAYELLESRLGLGVRLLGASFFLIMRLLWMAVILDVTTKVVLLPLLGLPESYGPAICAILGLSTVIYSSMGGIRAVVMTDVIQTFILLSGAIAALGLISWQMGGILGWWPTVWAENWDPPSLGFDPHSRMSLAGVFISTFFWYLCTAGSDQMAIQRYLSTRDAASARRMFSISMYVGVLVTILLAMLGLALLAWFRTHPEMLGEGQSIAHHGDQLFPRFIVAGMPQGVSGLVVAGLLAAAMSSLSSGLSSSCAVITVDFIDRLRGTEISAASQVRRARYVSWGLGFVIVLLSTVVGLVQGNVLEVAFKVVNLLVAPLFGLFFMALFVRWATSFGTFVGAAAGLATVIAINYWTELTGRSGISFLWSMPFGLLVQTTVGSLISLLPIGKSKPFVSSDRLV